MPSTNVAGSARMRPANRARLIRSAQRQIDRWASSAYLDLEDRHVLADRLAGDDR